MFDRNLGHESGRLAIIGVLYGGLAGVITGLTFIGMTELQRVLWSFSSARWYVFAVVLAGGATIAALRRGMPEVILAELFNGRVHGLKWKRVAIVAATGIVAVGFGGSVGPEAGLVAVAAELSALTSFVIARSSRESEAIAQAGNAAALAGFYGSPPAGVAYGDDSIQAAKGPQLLAAVAGFFGFFVILRIFTYQGSVIHIPLPPRAEPKTVVLAVVPALAGFALGLCYLQLRQWVSRLLRWIGNRGVQTLMGSLLLAGLLAAWPILRFSGHHEMEVVDRYLRKEAWLALLALALLKVLATALSLASGWLGGDFFPLLFAGSAAGALMTVIVPGLDPGTAMVAGLAATVSVGLQKPILVMLVVVFLLPGVAIMPLMVGVLLSGLLCRVFAVSSSSHA